MSIVSPRRKVEIPGIKEDLLRSLLPTLPGRHTQAERGYVSSLVTAEVAA
jgi:hypothetical protein